MPEEKHGREKKITDHRLRELRRTICIQYYLCIIILLCRLRIYFIFNKSLAQLYCVNYVHVHATYCLETFVRPTNETGRRTKTSICTTINVVTPV